MQVTLGGDRLGSGKKMKVRLHGYERSNHNMSYLFRSTTAAGTLVPYLCEPALPGDTFDIDLEVDIKTLPTVGPLFGTAKVQLDVFQAPIRLYQGQLHNNKLGIGMKMNEVKLPIIQLKANITPLTDNPDLNNAQINPSCVLKYLGISGVGVDLTGLQPLRDFNGVPLLAYWDIYKNYYSNKQEEVGAVIHTSVGALIETVDTILANGIPLAMAPAESNIFMITTTQFLIAYTGTPPKPNQIMIQDMYGRNINLGDLSTGLWTDDGTQLIGTYNYSKYGAMFLKSWRYLKPGEIPKQSIAVKTFPLENIDTMRERILAHAVNSSAFNINTQNLEPYSLVLGSSNGFQHKLGSQEGLALKTYQSDLFNNWLSTEWIDGPAGINEITAIDTSDGSFTIDTLNLANKVYQMLNRIAVSGGTYDDWLDAVYTHDRYTRCESPMYMGGLIRELVFQEVVSNTETTTDENGFQPLGSLAGRGVLSGKKKGGQIRIKVDEPSYIIGIFSITPRVDYSQGNKWDVHLKTMDDLHKPALDEIGFQDLQREDMAWWDTVYAEPGQWETRSQGKQPAWINYMTNVNRTYGDFAIPDNSMWMTFNRNYEFDNLYDGITDATTYIDPSKYNNIFANTALDSQNYWVQIAVDMYARRKMSAKIMPNL